MPRDSRNARIQSTTRGDSIYTLARFGMEDFNPTTATAYLITSTADEPPVEAPAHPADGPTIVTRYGTTTDPVRRIPERDKGVTATDGKIAARRREGDG
jgi:hypothetical protein